MSKDINVKFIPYFDASITLIPNEELFKKYFKIRQFECKFK
jgi:hypothetical protein